MFERAQNFVTRGMKSPVVLLLPISVSLWAVFKLQHFLGTFARSADGQVSHKINCANQNPSFVSTVVYLSLISPLKTGRLMYQDNNLVWEGIKNSPDTQHHFFSFSSVRVGGLVCVQW